MKALFPPHSSAEHSFAGSTVFWLRLAALGLLRFFAANSLEAILCGEAVGLVKRGDGALVKAGLGPVHERRRGFQRWAHERFMEVRLPFIRGNSIYFER